MDLNTLIQTLYKENQVLARARHAYLMKEAEKRHYEAKLTSLQTAKSHAEKLTLAQSSEEWLTFHRELAKLESIYQFELFKFRIIELQYQSTYLEMKQDGEHVKRASVDDERRNDYRPL